MTLNQKDSASEEILTQNIWHLVVRLSVPGILGMMLVGLNTFIDAVFVGQLLGDEALAAVSLAFPLTLVVTGFGSMIGTGSASVLSRAIGARDTATQEKIFGNLTILCLIISVCFGLIFYVWAEPLIRLMGGTGEILGLGARYFAVTALGAFFSIFGLAANILIRAEGKIKQAMIFAGASMLTNVTVTPIFIAVLGWGIEGAALGMIAAMLVYSALNFYYFVSGRSSFTVNRRRFKVEPDLLKPVLGIGVSALLMQVMNLLQQTFVFNSIARYGTARDIAFMGAGYRILSFAIIPIFGLIYTLQPIVGINYGAGSYERVKQAVKVFTLAGTGLMLLFWLPMQLFPAATLALMLPDLAFSASDLLNFHILTLPIPVFPLMFMSLTLYLALGNGKLAGSLIIARQVILFIPAVLLLPLFWGVNGIYYSLTVVDGGVAAVVAYWTYREFKKLDQQAQSSPAGLEVESLQRV